MISLVRAANELQQWIESKQWRFCFIGGLALQAWGDNRLTRDIDLSLFTGFQDEKAVIQSVLERYPPRRPDAAEFATISRVLLAATDTGIPIDIALAGFPFEEAVIARSVLVTYAQDIKLRICCANDLVVLKAFAAREQDWVDIRGILTRQGKSLDKEVIIEQLSALAEFKDEDILGRLEQMFSSTVK